MVFIKKCKIVAKLFEPKAPYQAMTKTNIFYRITQYLFLLLFCFYTLSELLSVEPWTRSMKIFLIIATYILLLTTWAEAKRKSIKKKREVWGLEVCSKDGQIFQNRKAALAAGKNHLCYLGAADCHCIWLNKSSLDYHYDYWHWQMASKEKTFDERKFWAGLHYLKIIFSMII